MADVPFSQRLGIPAAQRERAIENDATRTVRHYVVKLAKGKLGADTVREILCERMIREPDPNNWSSPNVWGEVRQLIQDCEWFIVYDAAEDIYKALYRELDNTSAEEYESEFNRVLASKGIAFEMKKGLVSPSHQEAVRELVSRAGAALEAAGLPTAREAIEGAFRDLSKRPTPDTIGAVHKALAAQEATMRKLTGDSKSTLGELLKNHPLAFPPPLGGKDGGLAKLWGFASETGRHLREGGKADTPEAELAVGVSASACLYLALKMSEKAPPSTQLDTR